MEAVTAETVEALLVERAEADRRFRMTELERLLLLQVHDMSWTYDVHGSVNSKSVDGMI